jgi:hypothetical protein
MDGVPGFPQLVCESKESGCLSLRVVKQQYLGHNVQSAAGRRVGVAVSS